MHRYAERPALEVEHCHLDGGFRLGLGGGVLVHPGEQTVHVGRVHADEARREPTDRCVDTVGRDLRVARRRIHVAPALMAVVGHDVREHAPLQSGDTMHALDRLVERYLDEDCLETGDLHGLHLDAVIGL